MVIELIKTNLPIDLKIAFKDAGALGPQAPPFPYDPRIESTRVATPLPILAEVRVSLCIDETLAWLLPVQFCVDQLLTAEEIVTKLADAFWFLKAWSQVRILLVGLATRHILDGCAFAKTTVNCLSRMFQTGFQ